MRRIVPAGLAGTVAVLLGLAPAGTASAAEPRVVDVGGLTGRAVDIAAAGRIADGGAIVVGTVTPRGRSARSRLVVARLRSDGLVDTSFGRDGVATVQLARGAGAGSRGTAVAVEPAGGRSWIGAAVGSRSSGAVLALDRRGRRVRAFGTGGVVRLAGDAAAPVALAAAGGRLAVAAGPPPCRGCAVVVLDARSGRRGAQGALAPVTGDLAACAGAQVGSLAFAGPGRLVAGGSGGACPTRVAVHDAALAFAGVLPVEGSERNAVAPAGPPLDVCVAVERDGRIGLRRLAVASADAEGEVPGPAPPSAPAGRLAAVTSLGSTGCAALATARPGAPAQVLQGTGEAAPAATALPAGFRPGTLFRCRRHVLVVGTRRAGGRERGAVAVVPIARS